KTRLLLEFLKERGLYFFVNKNKTSNDLLDEYQEILRKGRVLNELESVDSWDKFFEILIKRDVPPVVFDEFQNFSFAEPTVLGIMQKTIDLNENKAGLLILSGSLIGLMKNLFKSSKEPLYGRIKKGFKLEPLSLESCLELGKELKLNKEDLVKIYCVFGGYPKYFVAIEDFGLQGKKAEEIFDSLLLAKDAPLEDEVNSILSQEFGGRSGVYYSILEAIASGNNTNSAIASALNTSPTSITRQIKELKDYFELIELELPFDGKRGIYKIRHPLTQFWFSEIYKNYSDYVARKPEFLEKLKKNLNSVYGRAFEKVAKEFLVGRLELKEAKRQWGKIQGAKKGENTYEIDLIGKNCKETFAFEFKWSELSNKEANSILNGLEGKTRHLPEKIRGLKLGLVAKKIEGKQKLGAGGFLAFDLDDF
ncbi:MAG: ATP-binding protein, partial [archaeon]